MNEWNERKLTLPDVPEAYHLSLRRGWVEGERVEGDRLPGYGERVEVTPLEHFTADERHRAGVAGLVALALYVLAVIIILAFAGVLDTGSDDPPPATPPTTYGWPGPTGGPL